MEHRPRRGIVLAARFAAGVLAAVYALSCVVQFNDPDPAGWVAIYLAAAALAARAAAGRPHALAAGVLAAIAVGWAATKAPAVPRYVASVRAHERDVTAFYMHAGDDAEEDARECGGLVIVAVGCAAIAAAGRRRRPIPRPTA